MKKKLSRQWFGKKRGKFRVSPANERTWKEIVFHSKLEMLLGQALFAGLEAGVWVEVERQVKIELAEFVTYVADFVAMTPEGKKIVWEAKGAETAAWKRVKKAWKKYGPYEMRVVKYRGRGFGITETLPAGTDAPRGL